MHRDIINAEIRCQRGISRRPELHANRLSGKRRKAETALLRVDSGCALAQIAVGCQRRKQRPRRIPHFNKEFIELRGRRCFIRGDIEPEGQSGC